jgi:hypothetical protein
MPKNPATISCLLDLGAIFCYMDYVDLDELEWASNLLWYNDAIDALEPLSCSKSTFRDIIVYFDLLIKMDLLLPSPDQSWTWQNIGRASGSPGKTLCTQLPVVASR